MRSRASDKFANRVDSLLESGHWKAWDGKEPPRFIVDRDSWAIYSKMDNSGRYKGKKRKRIGGKL